MSGLSIIRQILEAASTEGAAGFDGATETQIMSKASISYDQLNKYLKILTDNGVLRYDEQRQTYKTTEKGLRSLEICEETLNMKRKVNDDKDNKPLPKLLIVDDDSDIVQVLKRGLEANGFLVDAYSSSKEALNAFRPDVYDLAILDVRMPSLNGFELYREIRKLDPSLIACFLSAFEIYPKEFKIVFPSMSEGIKTIIKKPIAIRDLINQITPFLKMSAQARAVQGEHVLVVYDTQMEMIEQSLEFLKIGIMNNEDVMFVTDGMPVDLIREKIAREWEGVDLETMEQEGRIRLHTFREWYMPDGNFDLQNAITRLREKIQQTSEHGRKGFRCVGDMNPFFDMGMMDKAINYEKKLEKNFDLPLIGFCAYIKDRFSLLDDSSVQLLYQHHNRVIGLTT
ncbi:MAG: MEDS domain-containing protein [Thermoproteota archaeon]|nr:MEDS domain-containing protein [Thermoproteota archaeon]